MRNWIKKGLIVTAITLLTTSTLSLAALLYYQSTKTTKQEHAELDPPTSITPDPSQPENPPNNVNPDKNSQRYFLSNYFNPYKFLELSTNYHDYFNFDQFNFNFRKIELNSFVFLRDVVQKAMNLDLKNNELKLNAYYQLTSSNQNCLLVVKWKIKSNNNLVEIQKKYYDYIKVEITRT